MLTLYSYWRSSASYRVRIALALKGLEPEIHPVHLLRGGGEQHESAYRAVNPQGRVPALQHDGHTITQSLAIIEYLDELYPSPPLLPVAATERARVRGLAQLIACDIQPLQNASTTRYLQQVIGLEPAAIGAWLNEWIGRGFAALEANLDAAAGAGRFAHGDHPSLADCCLVPQCYAARRFGVDLERYPNILRIEHACTALDAFRRASPERQPDRE